MKASVTIPSNELKRLTLGAIGGNTFSQRVINEIMGRLLDRIQRDYPYMLKGIYTDVHKRYQTHVALSLKQQRESHRRNVYGE